VNGQVAAWIRRIAWIAALALALGAARADAAGDQRELKAREDFAAGRYQQALDAFAKLYAETLHPTYLRNIGRCYQNLGDPDHAITSFREYLRKHKTITADERAEVEGFIAEMEELQKKKAAGASGPHPGNANATAQSSTITPLPTAPEPKSSGTPDALVTKPSAPAAEEPSVFSRWWFWTIVGAAAIGAGLGIAAATGALTKTQDAGCMTGYNCQ
jgi:hypothetical protein